MEETSVTERRMVAVVFREVPLCRHDTRTLIISSASWKEYWRRGGAQVPPLPSRSAPLPTTSGVKMTTTTVVDRSEIGDGRAR